MCSTVQRENDGTKQISNSLRSSEFNKEKSKIQCDSYPKRDKTCLVLESMNAVFTQVRATAVEAFSCLQNQYVRDLNTCPYNMSVAI